MGNYFQIRVYLILLDIIKSVNRYYYVCGNRILHLLEKVQPGRKPKIRSPLALLMSQKQEVNLNK